MRIFLTGDTHGNAVGEMSRFSSESFPDGKNLTKDDLVIVLGDFGLIFRPNMTKEEFYWLNWLSEKPWTTVFLDGNHENFDRLYQLPEEEKWGWKVGVVDFELDWAKITKPIYHLKRGQIFDFGGKKTFVMGWALSIDKDFRTPFISWWPQEIPSYPEMEEAYANLEKEGNKVDIIFTHTCPSNEIDNIFNWGFSQKVNDNAARFLDVIKWSVEFKHWYFGHFHKESSNDKFTCLYNKILEIDLTKI